MEKKISIIGGGLAGSEAAYTIARAGYKVDLYEMKPVKFSLAHSNENLAEIVCSNSFKSNLLTNACGLLKEELRMLDSLLIKIADMTSVPAGQALAVDRELFSKKVTDVIKDNSNINVINEEVGSRYDTNFSGICIEDLIKEGIVVIATGPLTSDSLSIGIAKLINEDSLHFYDAAAPIIEKDSIDFDIAFYGNRYEQEKSKDEDFDSWIDRINNIEKNVKEKLEKYINEDRKGMERDIEKLKSENLNLKKEISKIYEILKDKKEVVSDVVVVDKFEFDKTDISKDNMKKIDEFLGKRKISILNIIGHTDKVGTEEYNIDLSLRRAKSVKEYIKNKMLYGVINIFGKGEKEPISSNDEENRRVELIVEEE